MTFGRALESMLRRTGYSLVSEFLTGDRRPAVRLRSLESNAVVAMYHCDAIELARGGATIAEIVYRNRSVFGSVASQTTAVHGRHDDGGQVALPGRGATTREQRTSDRRYQEVTRSSGEDLSG